MGSALVDHSKLQRLSSEQSPETWIASNISSLPDLSHKQVVSYFQRSEFTDELLVCVTLCNDDFTLQFRSYLCDFSQKPPLCKFLTSKNVDMSYLRQLSPNLRLLWIRVRMKPFSYVLINGLPWEDLSIGFQCRVNRFPNVYNSKFWDHFSNHYIGSPAQVDTL